MCICSQVTFTMCLFVFFVVDETKVLNFVNHNLDDVITPVDAEMFKHLLTECGYDKQKTAYIYNGFKHGFSLCYEGNLKKV